MNVKYHAAIGIAGELAAPCHGVFFALSVLPDAPLILNELRLRWRGERFDPWLVSPTAFVAYNLTHSSLTTLMLFPISRVACLAHFIHTVTDWFTHTGRFAARPLYPLSQWRIKFGKDVLK